MLNLRNRLQGNVTVKYRRVLHVESERKKDFYNEKKRN